MDQSEEQVRELIANLAPRVNKALSQQNTVPPIGLLLFDGGAVEVILSPGLCERGSRRVSGEQPKLLREMQYSCRVKSITPTRS